MDLLEGTYNLGMKVLVDYFSISDLNKFIHLNYINRMDLFSQMLNRLKMKGVKLFSGELIVLNN